ncbi:hypothetical protein NC652_034138 [Populus alba x Populus x berolinensis]|nr:hypothetical protein NC652_034138 [Populus alba x Populus x berolinensis]
MTKFSSDAKDSYISLIQEAPFQRNWPVCASGNNFMDKKRSRATTTLLTFIIDSGTSFQKRFFLNIMEKKLADVVLFRLQTLRPQSYSISRKLLRPEKNLYNKNDDKHFSENSHNNVRTMGEEDMEELAIAMPRRPLKLEQTLAISYWLLQQIKSDKLISRFPHVRSGETDLFELEAWKSWASSSCLVSPSGGEASELASCGIANATGWSSL